MTVAWHKTLAFRLFAFVSTVLLVALSATTARHLQLFRELLYGHLGDGASVMAKEAAAGVASAIDAYASLLPLVMHGLAGSPPAQQQGLLDGVVAGNREIVAIQVLKAGGKPGELGFAFTSETGDIRFEGAIPERLREDLRASTAAWVKERAAERGKLSLRVTPSGAATPLLSLALAFTLPRGEGRAWAVVSVWMTRVLQALPAGTLNRGALFDAESGALLAAGPLPPSLEELIGRELAADVRKRKHTPTGVDLGVATDGRRRLAAFARVPKLALTAVVVRDADAAVDAVHRILLQTALLVWLFLLGVVFISYFAADRLTRGLKRLAHVATEIAGGNFEVRLPASGGDEVGVVESAVNVMARQIKELLRARVEAARQEKELETARVVQATLFPRADEPPRSAHVAARSLSASECGGDWWGRYTTSSGLECVMLADATGHGAPAALVAAMACASFHAVVRWLDEAHGGAVVPSAILAAMDATFRHIGRGETTMTATLFVFDPTALRVTFCSAGHPPAYIVPLRKDDPRLEGGRIVTALNQSDPIGLPVGTGFKDRTLTLRPGDRVILYTDGLVECTDALGKRYPFKRSLSRLVDAAAESGEALLEAVLDEALGHFKAHPRADDVTVVVVELPEAAEETQHVRAS